MSSSPVLDLLIQKLISRKFLVFVIATVAMFLGSLDATSWTTIVSIYTGSEAAIDGLRVWRASQDTTSPEQ